MGNFLVTQQVVNERITEGGSSKADSLGKEGLEVYGSRSSCSLKAPEHIADGCKLTQRKLSGVGRVDQGHD